MSFSLSAKIFFFSFFSLLTLIFLLSSFLLLALTYEGTLEWNDKGWSWLTQPSEDPLVFYPPDGSSGYAYTENPLDVYNRQFNLSEPKSNFGELFFIFPFFSLPKLNLIFFFFFFSGFC